MGKRFELFSLTPRLRGDDETQTSHAGCDRFDVVPAPTRPSGRAAGRGDHREDGRRNDELNRKETGKPVQTEQKVILGELDKLISSLEKKCDECRGMKANNPTRGMDDSMIRRGTGGIGALVDPRENNKDWAKLSDRERDRILQSMSEGFPPEYRTVLERYYRRLAEEKRSPATEVAPAAKPAESPKAAGKSS